MEGKLGITGARHVETTCNRLDPITPISNEQNRAVTNFTRGFVIPIRNRRRNAGWMKKVGVVVLVRTSFLAFVPSLLFPKNIYTCNRLTSPAPASSPLPLSVPHSDPPRNTLLGPPTSVCSTNETCKKIHTTDVQLKMAVESVPVQPQAASPTEVQIEKDAVRSASDAVEEKKDEVEALQEQVEAVNLGNVDDLHAACVEGKLQDVRALLSKGTDRLETLGECYDGLLSATWTAWMFCLGRKANVCPVDVNSGCTPIVLAIRANHHDIVRELLAAGAIIPPPGLTNDPLMLSILYPQPVYGMPPQFMSIPPQDFYPQPNYFRSQNNETQQFPLRKDSASAPNGNGSASNLPPAEVSKSIPCRNFPNCKYGNACVFLHPRPAPFYPGPGQNGFAPQGYEGYPPYPPAPAPYFMPNGNNFQSFASSEAQPQVSDNAEAGVQLDNAPIAAVPTPNGAAPVSVPAPPHVPSAVAPVFIPGYQPADMMGSPPPPPFGLSPMSPSMLGSSLPSIPPAEVFFATSPTNGFMPPVPMTGPHARRQSFGQGPQFGGQGKPFGHGKKPSFSSGKPWTGNRPAGGKFGNWKDGNPPPCAFFSQGNCRNGEFCKFPHLDADGNDCKLLHNDCTACY